MSERDFLEWSQREPNRVLVFRVIDRFGDYGLTGIAGLTILNDGAELVDFVLSCRVMGRGVEHTMLHTIVAESKAAGATHVLAAPVPTPRNQPCRSFFENESGFRTSNDSDVQTWDTSEDYPMPKHVDLELKCGSAVE